MVGKILGDRYQIMSLVGIGGMAKVYKALDKVLNRYVAVKVLKEEYMDDEDFLKKFAMEAQSAASLTHSNIVSVFDVGSSYADGKKYNYIVMEFVDGHTLKEIIDSKDYLSEKEIVNYGVQIAQALECAHRNGIIHRDIKPHNILIDKNDNLKATDFGIARISSSATITYTSTVLGTVHYISPEQAKGKFIDEKSDIYSLGVVLYEMATGTVPFDASNAVGIALKHIQDPLIEPKDLRNDLSQGLNDIIIKAMSKDPADRFQTASRIKEALRNYKNYEDDNLAATSNVIPIPTHEKQIEQEKAVYTTPMEEEEPIVEERSRVSLRKIAYIIMAILLFSVATVFGARYFSASQSNIVKVPALSGLKEAVAKEQVESRGLKFVVSEREENSELEKGVVIRSIPPANRSINKGGTVQAIVSEGKAEIGVPNLTNMTLENAESALIKNNLELGTVQKSYSDQFVSGKIIKQDPSYGKSIAVKSKVNVTVSLGPSEKIVSMINLIGMSEEKAIIALENLGLNVGNIEYRSNSNYDPGAVIWQQYSVGSDLKQGTTINLIVKSKEQAEPTHQYEFNIPKPEVDHNYNIRITKVTNDGEYEVYNQDHLPDEGDVTVRIMEANNAKFNIYVDGVKVNEE